MNKDISISILSHKSKNLVINLIKKLCNKFPIIVVDNSDDLELERKLNKPTGEILETFFSKEYFCYMTGFIAGMPFLGDIDKNLYAKRLETPRVKVPKGSIGLTEQFCNIYTFESPGGWNIIGNTPLNVFDSLNEDNPNLINPGDTVSFIKINKEKYKNYNE